MKKTKSISEWVSSSFGSDGNPKITMATKRKKRPPSKKKGDNPWREDHMTKSQHSPPTPGGLASHDSTGGTLWADKHAPKTSSELVVHKKKVMEVQQWLEWALIEAPGRVCLLTGPSGCGKTATVRSLANDLKCELLEWINPMTTTEHNPQSDVLDGQHHFSYAPSQTKLFTSFLNTADRYPSLQLASDGNKTRKIVLIEELPNVFLRDSSRFHDLLRKQLQHCRYPLVFIITDSPCCSVAKLFPKHLTTSLDINTISFNPVAHTALMKLAQVVIATECGGWSRGRGGFVAPTKCVVEALVTGSNGDVRALLNSLQFACLKDPNLLTGRGHSWTARDDDSFTTAIGAKDSPLFLFRSLGKILYCKRGEEVRDDCGIHKRPPLLVNPEEVLYNTHISASYFVLYLHQNYMSFFSDVEQLADASGYLSDADHMISTWSDSSVVMDMMMSCGASVATRGIMYSNYPRPVATGNKWRPLHKPQWLDVNRRYHDNCLAVRDVFLHLNMSPHAHLWTPVELQTEILPYTALLSEVVLRNEVQASLLQSLTHFTTASHFYRNRPELLGDKDIDIIGNSPVDRATPAEEVMIIDEGDPVQAPEQHTLSQNTTTTCCSGAECNDDIEEFEDDDIW